MLMVVCGLIEDGAGRVLACRRGPGRALAGLWEFPGGKCEPNEPPEAALARELHEELGCQVELVAPLAPVEHAYPNLHIRLLPWRCRLTGGSIHAHEHAELRWLTPADGDQLDWAPADIPIWQEWCAMVRKKSSGKW